MTAAARSSDNSVTDNTNRQLDWGPTKMNRPHIFNASLILMLPTFENKSGFVKNVLGDWEVAAIAAASSGQSHHGLLRRPPEPQLALWQRELTRTTTRPMRVAGSVVPGERREQGADPQPGRLHRSPATSSGRRATPGRGICEGPRYFQVDLSLYKNINISKRVKAQLRFEVFNIFNHVNFLQGSVEHGLRSDHRDLRHRRPGHRDDRHRLHDPGRLRPGLHDTRPEAGAVRHQADLLRSPFA